ncbi:MAG TPA: glycosyltransferase family 41 protein [Methylothermaceae bacterium]|nr:glycosyltransferase family 41 protein [Methylothermaceae bacterium]
MNSAALRQRGLDKLRVGRNKDASALFEQAARLAPGDRECWYYLGVALVRSGQFDAAIRALDRAIRLDAGFGQAYFWKGRACLYGGDPRGSLSSLRQAIRSGYRSALVWNSLGLVLEQLGDWEEAERSFTHAMRADPRDSAAYANLARVLHHQGKDERVGALYREALKLDPNNLKAAVCGLLHLPVIFRDREHLASCRARYLSGVDELSSRWKSFTGPGVRLNDLLSYDAFHLAYQGGDDRLPRQRFGEFYTRVLGAARSQFMRSMPQRPVTGRRIRIAYVSHFLREHTVFRYFRRWIEAADRDDFEVFAFHLDPLEGVYDDGMDRIAEHYIPFRGQISAAAEAIRASRPDILVYLEVGMYPRHMWLASMRLAPVQCVAWGHPETTGLPNIDYFISADNMEPAGADAHYSERLVRLPGIGVDYAAERAPTPAEPGEFGLPPERPLYFCAQSLFKIHVDMDALMAAIAVRDPEALFVFFRDGRPAVDRVFQERMRQVFSVHGLDPEHHLFFLDRVSAGQYLRVSQCADVMLDSLHFSGGRTSLDAFACGIPVITCEGDFARGRQTAGMLRQMGMDEWIARDTADYVEKAVAIAHQPELRGRFRGQLAERAPRYLFGDSRPLEALETFYRQAVGGTTGPGA